MYVLESLKLVHIDAALTLTVLLKMGMHISPILTETELTELTVTVQAAWTAPEQWGCTTLSGTRRFFPFVHVLIIRYD